MLPEAILAFTDDTGYDIDRAIDLIPGKRKCTREACLLPHPYSSWAQTAHRGRACTDKAQGTEG